MQPPHESIREIDCMGANCAVWRRKVFERGLRFSPFFVDYGVGEDAHIALSAKKLGWTIWECGRAHCVHQQSPRARTNRRRVAWKTAVNYRFLFVDIVGQLSARQEFRFWRVQLVELAHEIMSALLRRRKEDWVSALGKFEGIIEAVRMYSLVDRSATGRARVSGRGSTMARASEGARSASVLAGNALGSVPEGTRAD